jgi:hypothetical protein
VNSPYLSHDDPRAYEGLVARVPPELHVACPKCKGHGGWILTPKARGHAYDGHNGGTCRDATGWKQICNGIHHFMSSCDQCNGWGYVKADSLNESCIHEMKHEANHGNCLNSYKCVKCGTRRMIDSSD